MHSGLSSGDVEKSLLELNLIARNCANIGVFGGKERF